MATVILPNMRLGKSPQPTLMVDFIRPTSKLLWSESSVALLLLVALSRVEHSEVVEDKSDFNVLVLPFLGTELIC